MESTQHADGTICPEGKRRVRRGFIACCEFFSDHTTSCYYDVRFEWWAKSKNWVIIIPEIAGGGGISISFCPNCGSKL